MTDHSSSLPHAAAHSGFASVVPAPRQLVTVEVRTETPFLPKAAFFLISLASLGGTYLTGRLHGLEGFPALWRWLPFWALALSTGMLAWRLFYLRPTEVGLGAERVARLHADLLGRVKVMSRWLAALLLVAAGASLVVPYLRPGAAWGLAGACLCLAVLVGAAHRSRVAAAAAFLLGGASLAGWALVDSGGLASVAAVRTVHLWAFAAWLGGALFNLGAAVPAGRRNANLDAVVAGARQLERFRWVVRTALPTIIVTGVWLASRYGGIDSPFWRGGVGLLVPFKLLLIVALIVIFITCPLYRACSPVRGVCNLDDLAGGSGEG